MAIENAVKVFIIDDHQIVINGIKLALNDPININCIGHALSGEEALIKLKNIEPDIILLDIQLPGIDGLELCKEIKKSYPSIKIIGLTTFSEVSFISEMMRNGANGYLFKDTSEKELIEAIQKVYKGDQYLSAQVNNKLINQILKKPKNRKGFIPKITRRELEVLQLIAAEHTTQEIADLLFLSKSTVEKHRINLFIKLEARNAVGLVKKAIKFGLIP